MTEFCSNCGEELNANAVFCPNCGCKVKISSEEPTYEELIRNIIYVDDRISKAKAIGVVIFLIYIIAYLFYIAPSSLREGPILFIIFTFFAYIDGLFYYAVCRGVGFLIRTYVIK